MTDLSQVSDADLLASLPRGIRNNNPLNLKARGSAGQDGPFAVYSTPEEGIAAADRNLQAYSTKHGLNTVAGIVNRWAPPNADGNHTAAYTAHVARSLNVDPNAPLDMVNPETRKALIGAMGEFENGAPITQQSTAPANDLASVSDADLLASLGHAQPPPRAVPQRQAPRPAVSQRLGFEQGGGKLGENVAHWAQAGMDKLGIEPADWLMRGAKNLQGAQAAVEAQHPEVYKATPGKAGEFFGQVGATSWVPGGPLLSGAAQGALLSDKKDLGGVLGDAALGGLTGRLAAGASDLAQLGARKLLSKAPQIMDLAALQKAKKAAYDAVDASGFAFPKGQVAALVSDFEKTLGSRALSKSAKEDANSIISYARSLAKGDVSLSQMEKLRGDIYDSMVAKGGDTAAIGGAFREKIGSMIDAADNGLVRTARDLNSRWKKADYLTRASNSADLAAEKAYGGDYGRKLKDRVAPLVDPLSKQRNFRGATPDEAAALNKIARGTKLQNATSTVAGMLDPRRLGGKMVSAALTTGGGASVPFTGGLSLLLPATQMATGLGLTGVTSKIARKNLDDAIRLIAAGGSKQAVSPVATPASQTMETLIAALRPALVAASVPALAAARRPEKAKPRAGK